MTDTQRRDADEQRVRDLFERALRTGAAGDPTARWGQVGELHRTGGEFAQHEAIRLCASDDPERRRLAADVLGQVGGSTAEAVRALLALASREDDPYVMSAICIALGHRHDPRAVGPLRRWRAHPDEVVRYAVAHGLLGLAGEEAVATLVEMSADPDHAVRDWVTFGLAHRVTTNTPAVRDALAARLYDPNHDTRADAIAGLARRDDDRVVAALLDALASDDWPGYNPELIHTALHQVAWTTEDRRLWRYVRDHPTWLDRRR